MHLEKFCTSKTASTVMMIIKISLDSNRESVVYWYRSGYASRSRVICIMFVCSCVTT